MSVVQWWLAVLDRPSSREAWRMVMLPRRDYPELHLRLGPLEMV